MQSYEHDRDTARRTLDDYRRERAELQNVVSRLINFLQNYPSGWLDQLRRPIERAHVQQQEGYEQLRRLEIQQDNQQNLYSVLSNRRSELTSALSKLERHQIRLELAAQQHPEAPSELDSRLTQLQSAAAQYQIEHDQWNEATTQALNEIENASRSRRQLASDLQSTQDILNSVTYVEADLPTVAGDWEQLRKTFELLRDRYEQRINRDELSGMLKRTQQQANEAQEVFFKRCRRESLNQVTVRAVLGSIRDTDELSEHLQQAIAAHRDNQRDVENRTHDINRTQDELYSLEIRCSEQHIEEDRLEDNTGSSEDLALVAEQEFHNSTDLAKQQDEIAHQAGLDMKDTEQRLQILNRDLQQLRKLNETASNLYMRIQQGDSCTLPSGTTWTLPVDDAIGDAINELEETIQAAQKTCDQLDQRRTTAMKDIRHCFNDEVFANLQGQLIRTLRSYSDEEYEQNCDYLLSQLSLRLQTVKAALASIQPHQEQLIDETLSVAKRSIALLKSLTLRSRLPPTLPAFGERSFLKVAIDDELNLADQRARIARLIDEIVQTRRMPSGIGLVQQSVRCLCESIQIEILFPDPQARRPYDDIPKLARRSGGERLTCAIMLYCTLAQLRAHELGRSSGSSALLLDNPIGTASYPEFLTLQREVARAMNIQLIYTAANNDYEAIRVLPNIERLCNDRFDNDTGEQIIERDDIISTNTANGHLSNARLLLSDLW